MAQRRRSSSTARGKKSVPVARHHLGKEILRSLRERILNWHYPPGRHLGEEMLCAEFAASRIPVREALRVLAEQGLVDKVPNMGCYVKQPDVEGIHQLYDYRLALELFVVERLAETGPSAELAAKVRATWEPLLFVKADEAVDGDVLARWGIRISSRRSRTLMSGCVLCGSW
jgi:DNA-binding GntR family transcriptional regulator